MDTTKKPVPKYGETVKNADGSIAGVAVFDPNTGKALAGAQQFNPNTGTAITADQLAPVQPLKLPENAPDTTASDFINRQIEGLNVSKEKSVIDTEAEKVATEKKTSIDALLAAMNDVGVVEDKQSQYEKEAGVDKFKKQRSEIQHAMEVESRVIKKNTDALLNDPTLTRGMALRMAGEAERISASKMADLAITEKAYGGLYQEALDIAKEKVEIQTKPLKRKVEKLEFAYNQNKDYFNDVQKAKLEGLIKTEDRKYNEEVKKKEDIEKYAITALQNGASQEVAKRIRESKTTGEAIEALGIYASDPLERRLKQIQITKALQSLSDGTIPTQAGTGQRQLSESEYKSFVSNQNVVTINDGARFRRALQDYKNAVEKYGTGEIFSAKGKGELTATYQTLVGTIKDYYKLGTLDNGVEKLVGLGVPKPNKLRIRDKRVINALETLTGQTDQTINNSVTQLANSPYADTIEFQTLVSQTLPSKSLSELSNEELLNASNNTVDNSSFYEI